MSLEDSTRPEAPGFPAPCSAIRPRTGPGDKALAAARRPAPKVRPPRVLRPPPPALRPSASRRHTAPRARQIRPPASRRRAPAASRPTLRPRQGRSVRTRPISVQARGRPTLRGCRRSSRTRRTDGSGWSARRSGHPHPAAALARERQGCAAQRLDRGRAHQQPRTVKHRKRHAKRGQKLGNAGSRGKNHGVSLDPAGRGFHARDAPTRLGQGANFHPRDHGTALQQGAHGRREIRDAFGLKIQGPVGTWASPGSSRRTSAASRSRTT